jgi:hypothetical protein
MRDNFVNACLTGDLDEVPGLEDVDAVKSFNHAEII